MKLVTGRDVPLCFLYDTPAYCYVLRLWLDDLVDGQSTASKVVIFKSNSPIGADKLFEQLIEIVGEKQAKKFHLIDIQCDSDVVLDTWEPELEASFGVGVPDESAVYKNWWSADDCQKVEIDELTK